jgi:hypothetical protein
MVHGASVAYEQSAYGRSTPESEAIVPAATDGRQDTLAVQFDHRTSWGPVDAERFRQLAAKSATGGVSAEEQAELAGLVRARRRFLTPMTVEQLRFEYERRQAVQVAVGAFDAYFRLVRAPRRPLA